MRASLVPLQFEEQLARGGFPKACRAVSTGRDYNLTVCTHGSASSLANAAYQRASKLRERVRDCKPRFGKALGIPGCNCAMKSLGPILRKNLFRLCGKSSGFSNHALSLSVPSKSTGRSRESKEHQCRT